MGSTKKCNLGSAALAGHVQVQSNNGEENSLIEGKRKLAGATRVSEEPMTFHCLSCDNLSLAELMPGKKSFLFLLALSSQGMRETLLIS